MRLSGTKATVARSILNGLSERGDEEDYYIAIRYYQNQSIDAKLSSYRWELSRKPGANEQINLLMKLSIMTIERYLVNFAGMVNAWGASVARPTAIGVLIVFIFSSIYWMTGIRASWLGALLASLDITLLIGYTRHAVNDITMGQKFVFCLNMLLGISWYSVFCRQ